MGLKTFKRENIICLVIKFAILIFIKFLNKINKKSIYCYILYPNRISQVRESIQYEVLNSNSN